MRHLQDMITRRMMTLLLLYLILLLTVFVLQRKLLYFPTRFTEAEQAKLAEQTNLKPWPSEEDQRGFITPMDDAKGTVLVFHGNAGAAIHRTYLVDGLQRQGYRVILAEYPGYGTRKGYPRESALIEDGIASTKLAFKEFKNPIFLCGESLGSGVVAGIAASHQVPIKGLLLITPFDSMTQIAQHHYWFFLARWLILDKYDNISRLKDFGNPVATLLAEHDELIPNQHTMVLFDSLWGPKRLWRFEDAHHNSLPFHPQQKWWREVMNFLS